MARTYHRDSRGRFASGGGSSGRQGPASPVRGRKAGSPPPKRRGLIPQRQAVARAKGKLSAMDSADPSISAANRRRGLKGAVTKAANNLAAAQATGTRRIQTAARDGVIRPGRSRKAQAITPQVMGPGSTAGARPPASQRPGSMTHTLRGMLRELAQSDARLIRDIEAATGLPIAPPKGRRGGTAKLPGSGTSGTGKVSDALRGSLRQLAQSDARLYRDMAQIIGETAPKLPGSSSKGKGSRRGRSRKALPGS